MKITDVQTVLLTGPCTADPYVLAARKLCSAALIEIRTDSPHTGVGETYAGYFCPEVVPAIVDFYRPILLGADPCDIHVLRARLEHCGIYWARVGLGAAVIAGIEAALYDLKGKALGLPVYELLGGRSHERLLTYATGSVSNWPPERLKEKLDFYLGLGYKAYKVATGYYDAQTRSAIPTHGTSEIVALEAGKAEMMRAHVGKGIGIAMDGHMGSHTGKVWDLPTARAVMQALEPYDLLFFEEPLPYTDPWGYGELNRSTSIPIAGGECLTTLEEFRQFADLGGFSIAQPDAAWSGGLNEFMRIARMFDSRKLKIASHSWGAGVAQMQNLHAGFAAPNTLVLETPPAPGTLHTELWGDSFVMKDGYMLPPEAPGLGVRLTDEIKQKFAFVPGTGEFVSVPGKLLTT